MSCITRGPAGAAFLLAMLLLLSAHASAAESSGPDAVAKKDAKAEGTQPAKAKKKKAGAKHASSKQSRSKKSQHETQPTHQASAENGDWYSRYSGPNLKLDYPVIDDALL